MTFPELSVQGIVSSDSWWVRDESRSVSRGRLIKCFVPHVDQVPYQFRPMGRSEATEHGAATVMVEPLRVGAPLTPLNLPVAAMPLHKNEVWAAYRAKRRPCLIISSDCPEVERKLTRGKSKSATAPTMLVVPYYGVAHGTNRAGYHSEFISRMIKCAYPQFFCDWLPFPGGEQSVMRLDHIQPIGCDPQSYEVTPFRLGHEAMKVVDQWLDWYIYGAIDPSADLKCIIELLRST